MEIGEGITSFNDDEASQRVNSAYEKGSYIYYSTWNNLQSGGGYVSNLHKDDYSSAWKLGLDGDVYEIVATSTKVFASTTEGIDCISATTGKLLWSRANEGGVEMRALEVSDDEQFLYVGLRNPLQVRQYGIDDGELLETVQMTDKGPCLIWTSTMAKCFVLDTPRSILNQVTWTIGPHFSRPELTFLASTRQFLMLKML